MKTNLLLFASMLALPCMAQEAIGGFYGLTPENGGDVYSMVESTGGIDHSPSGANMVWNFNDLTEVGESVTEVIPPTTEEIASYPGTTLLVKTTTQFNGGGEGVTHYFLNQNVAGEVQITGMEAAGLVLNYSGDNGYVGAFPVAYGYTQTDDVSGTFVYGTYSGTFSGTGTSDVDAYGTLTVNIGTANQMDVTRIKTVQNLTLSYMGLPVGTVTQTIYSYYSTTLSTGPVFRNITNHIVSAALSIDETLESSESYTASLLSTDECVNFIRFALWPNPVNDMLYVEGVDDINEVTIFDDSGRVVLKSQLSTAGMSANRINVSSLSKGVYYVTVQTANGTHQEKIIKQ